MKLTTIATLMLASALTFAATQNSTIANKNTNDKKNNEELRLALLNLNTNNSLTNIGENKNNDLIDELSNNEVNNGLNNLKNVNQ